MTWLRLLGTTGLAMSMAIWGAIFVSNGYDTGWILLAGSVLLHVDTIERAREWGREEE